MPTRETGIKGYVGEQVVKQWLNKTVCKSKEYNIVSQVKPVRIDNAGGPYLDFAVIKKGRRGTHSPFPQNPKTLTQLTQMP